MPRASNGSKSDTIGVSTARASGGVHCRHTNRLGLRLVIFGGEALDFQSLKPWFDRHGDQRPQLINMYGITETTVHVTYRVIKEADLHSGLSSLIGVPIPDLELYVLDPYLNLFRWVCRGVVCWRGGSGERLSESGRTDGGAIYRSSLRVIRARGSTGPGILFVICPTGTSSIWVASITRSRSGVIALSWGRSKSSPPAPFSARGCGFAREEDSPGDQQLVAYVVLNRDACAIGE